MLSMWIYDLLSVNKFISCVLIRKVMNKLMKCSNRWTEKWKNHIRRTFTDILNCNVCYTVILNLKDNKKISNFLAGKKEMENNTYAQKVFYSSPALSPASSLNVSHVSSQPDLLKLLLQSKTKWDKFSISSKQHRGQIRLPSSRLGLSPVSPKSIISYKCAKMLTFNFVAPSSKFFPPLLSTL